ncbi:Biotin synthase [Dissulfuribacter thermophilus]|uniref:Biotin synthase n=1 Tax=Dissulfuribacter thermophilus TaxID=1156395 RepID=A0A1B9F4R2_9BACT|nr:radical SAM protein [Dissulfuribacter thermophilus]OCC14731.1 Biotin synthase [Dissulfuribacter thermophilus]
MRQLNEIFKKAKDGQRLSDDDLRALLYQVRPGSEEYYHLLYLARRLTFEANGGLAEVHGQIGINVAPCPMDCGFCSFGKGSGVFKENKEIGLEAAVDLALRMEADGANAIYLMITADFPMDRFFEYAYAVKKALKPETPLVANIKDFTDQEAMALKEAGFVGVYHTVRLREGLDTGIAVKRRIETIEAAKDAGLILTYCVEPLGPEHTPEDIVAAAKVGRQYGAVFSGAMRRIPIAGSRLYEKGTITEMELSLVVAAIGLYMGTPFNCTHEPNMPSLMAGANIVWAETASNPRDTRENTEEGRGLSVRDCQRLLQEAGLRPLCPDYSLQSQNKNEDSPKRRIRSRSKLFNI